MKTLIILLALMITPWGISAQWVQTNGPKGFVGINSIMAKESILFAGTISVGYDTTENSAYRSTDDGDHWTFAGEGLPNAQVHAFAFNGNLAFAANQYDVYKSIDLGMHWEQTDFGLQNSNTLTTMAMVGSTVFGTTGSREVYRSVDSGDTWEPVNTGFAYQQNTDLVIEKDDLLYAGSGDGVYVSEDLGESWNRLNAEVGGPNPHAVYYLDARGDTIIAGSHSRIYLSVDNGLTWNTFYEGLDPLAVYITGLAISDNRFYAVVSGRIYQATLAEPNWTEVLNFGEWEPGIAILASTGSTLYAGTYSKGIYKSFGEDNWVEANSGMPNSATVEDIALIDQFILALAEEGTIFRTADKGLTWEIVPTDQEMLPSEVTDLFTQDQFMFAGTYENGVFRSTDHGDTWVPANGGIADQFVYAFGAMPPYLFVAADYGVYRSDNYGDTWTQVNNGLPGLGWLEVSSFAVYDGKLYVGVHGGDQDEYDNVYITADFGNTWTGIDDSFDDVNTLAVCGPYLFAGTHEGVFRYTDSTGLWTALPNGSMDYLDIITISLGSNGSVLFSGSYGRSYLTYDFGNTWKEIVDGLGKGVETFGFAGTDALAGPVGGGLYINTTLLTDVEYFSATVGEIRVHPNPASNTITVVVPDVSQDNHISIFNTNGQKVLDYPATELQTTIDISHLSAGAYFLRYANGMTKEVGKLIKE